MWSQCIGGKMGGKAGAEPPLTPSGSIMKWLGKKVALKHARECSPLALEEGLLENVEADLASGAKQCLTFLADCLGEGDKPSELRVASLQSPYMEDVLGERLRQMVSGLQQAERPWRWEVEEIEDAELDTLFLIMNASRSGTHRSQEIGIFGTFGQQICFYGDQLTKVRDRANMRNIFSLLQEVLVADMVLTADVLVDARQRSGLAGPGEKHVQLDTTEKVRHVLRLEMALTPDRTSELPNLRPSPWQIVDWNWICRGNHPAIPLRKRL